jgi:hypothetical protein
MGVLADWLLIVWDQWSEGRCMLDFCPEDGSVLHQLKDLAVSALQPSWEEGVVVSAWTHLLSFSVDQAALQRQSAVFCRVGRTGRAGNKGSAITFIGPDEERYAPDLVKALKESSAPVPQDLQVRGS